MFFYRTPVDGNLLPHGFLVLTFDDGPGTTPAPMPALGPRTDDLGFYLFQQGIPASFFVIGDHAANQPELCEQLMHQGHAVENHSQIHYGLAWELNDRTPADVIADVVDAGLSIGAAANPDSLLFRAPYLNWNEDVAAVLNNSDARSLTGPIWYGIGAYDYTFWRDTDLNADPNDPTSLAPNNQLARCVDSYYNDITAVGSGIVTFHDSEFEPWIAAKNQTFELIRLLIPRLIADGYRFIRLDAVPQVRSAILVSSIGGLRAQNGLYVSPSNGGGGSIPVNGQGLYQWEELGLVQLQNGQVAIRTPNGQFMSVQPTGEILANGTGVYDWERFDLLDQGSPVVALRAWTGNYVTVPSIGQYAGQIAATAAGLTLDEKFTLEILA